MKKGIWETDYKPDWCPGCGNHSLWQALKQTLDGLGVDPGETVVVAGIGCHGHVCNFTKVSSFEGLHGRPIPLATGIKLANHKLTVIVSTGDGDCLGEGGNHFLHAARRNHGLVCLIHDNASYSLTTGQASPTSPSGYKSKSTPFGKIEEAINPISLAIAAGATFVSRGFVGEPAHLSELMKAAIEHRGFALVDALQPCVVFNKELTHEFYQKRVYKLEKPESNRVRAFEKSLEWGERIPIGIFYQEKGGSFEEKIGRIKEKTLKEQPLRNFDWQRLIEEFY